MKGSWDSTSINLVTFSFIFLFILGAVFSVPTSKHLCPPEQRDALLEFKNAIKIGECSSYDSHPKTDSWKNNSDCCSWEGIKCNAELGEVIQINLSRSCLCHQFHSDCSFLGLRNLHFLTTLDLSYNYLNGPIPSSIGNLSHLTKLFLSSHLFLDQLPSSIGKLSRLTNLDISKNKFKGQVPTWLWTLPKLEYLDLSNNNFIGFERSSKHGQFCMTTPSMIKHLFGSKNNFTGNIPSSICDLRFLITLDLSDNNFNGSIPSCIRNLQNNLSDLNFRRNCRSGGVPGDIFESLRSLDVGHNQLVGKLPRSLIRFSSLEVLNVESNKINDTFPLWLSNLKELKVLVLSFNVFHGPIHQVSFPMLQIINISHNRFNGTLSSNYFVEWNAMSSLGENARLDTTIDFSGIKFEGEIPRSISILKQLHVLNLSNNAFSGGIPSSMGNLTALMSLDVSRNKLSGEIPQELENLSHFMYMDFSHNHLGGLLPRSYQLEHQPCSSFEDNMEFFSPHLYFCRNIHIPIYKKTLESEEEEEVISLKAAAIGYGLGLVFGFTLGYKLFSHFFSFSFQK